MIYFGFVVDPRVVHIGSNKQVLEPTRELDHPGKICRIELAFNEIQRC